MGMGMGFRCYVFRQGVVGWRLHSSVQVYDKYEEVGGKEGMLLCHDDDGDDDEEEKDRSNWAAKLPLQYICVVR